MPDREKVIKGLEICVDRVPGKYDCYECPYEIDGNYCEINLAKDALALLKKQEEHKFFVDESGKITPLPVVVRCKDCKWWDKKDDSNYGYCHACKHGYSSDHWEIGIYRTYKGDWFCADGEHK